MSYDNYRRYWHLEHIPYLEAINRELIYRYSVLLKPENSIKVSFYIQYCAEIHDVRMSGGSFNESAQFEETRLIKCSSEIWNDLTDDQKTYVHEILKKEGMR